MIEKVIFPMILMCFQINTSYSQDSTEYLVSDTVISPESERMNNYFRGGTEKNLEIHFTSAEEILTTAHKYLGVPYCIGGLGPTCLDCSGFLRIVFAAHGIQLPHNSEEQSRYGKIINSKNELRKGDLVFFIGSYSTHRFISHAGIFNGNDEFIHASSRGITITSINDPWWGDKFIFGTRIFE
jgi:cell wall-associated NlpC family hydrolase